MAIDGVKIIDSDEAHDIYHYVVDNYKDGKNIDKIIATILKDEKKLLHQCILYGNLLDRPCLFPMENRPFAGRNKKQNIGNHPKRSR